MIGNLTFASGAGTVTGANFLFETEPDVSAGTKSLKILVDCGLEQGSRFAETANREDFIYDPSPIDFLIVTHAHIDHV